MKAAQPVPIVYAIWKPKTKVETFLLAFAGSLFLALTAQIIIPLPYTPVPITGQTFGVLLIGALLGSGTGSLATVLYLLQACLGAPVLAGAVGGAAAVVGPTGGYIVGFVFSAYLTGKLFEAGWNSSFHQTVISLTLGTAVIFAFGLAWLAVFTPVNFLLAAGLFPFLPGAVVKIFLAATVIQSSQTYSNPE